MRARTSSISIALTAVLMAGGVAGCKSETDGAAAGQEAAQTEVAPPSFTGGPRTATDRMGAAVGDFGSFFAIKAQVNGDAAPRVGSFAFYDARPEAKRDVAAGNVSITFGEAGTPRLVAGREGAFRPWGWTEEKADGRLVARTEVFTVAPNVFATVISVSGVGAPLDVEVHLDGTGTSGNVEPDGNILTVRIDGKSFVAAVAATVPLEQVSQKDGKSYEGVARMRITDARTVALVTAFDQDPAQAKAKAAAQAAKATPEAWLAAVASDWKRYFESYPKAHDDNPRWLLADQHAKTLMRMNQVGPFEKDGPIGTYPAKTFYNAFWVWDTAFQVLAASETSSATAFDQLEMIYRSQVDDGSPERGLVPNHVDEDGEDMKVVPPFSQSPAFGMATRTLYERSVKGPADRDRLQRSYDVGTAFIDWWQRRRDWDGDGVIESNGGWENGMDNSPRFTDAPLWIDPTSRWPLPFGLQVRPPLNCIDIHAWLAQYAGAQAWSARVLGRDAEGAAWAQKKKNFVGQIEDAFWDDERGGYYDYYYGPLFGRKKYLQPRTPATFWPLLLGLAKDPERIRTMIGHILDPKEFWGPFGIPSVAFNDRRYDPAGYWRGPIWINVTYLTIEALYRYGYEAEAETLRERMLNLVSKNDEGIFEHYNADTGEGLKALQFGWSGAFTIEALRHRYQAEAFDLERGEPAKTRQGYLRRLVRFADDSSLLELEAEGSPDVPLTRVQADGGIFRTGTTMLTFSDPTGSLKGAKVSARLPAFCSAAITLRRADGSSERLQGRQGIAFAVHAGDSASVSDAIAVGSANCP